MPRFLAPTLALALPALLACTAPREATPVRDSGLKVRDIAIGRAIGPDKAVTAPAAAFAPNDTIYTSVVTDGKARTATVAARWTHNGALLEETEQRIAPSGTVISEFHVFNPSGWSPGEYRVEILLDGRSVGERTFRVDPAS
jgi:hypothetical protein